MGDAAPPGRKGQRSQLQKVPPARTIARLMTTARNQVSKADSITVAALEAGVPTLVDARTLSDRFHRRSEKEPRLISFPGLLPPAKA
jgi:hypothetical protein